MGGMAVREWGKQPSGWQVEIVEKRAAHNGCVVVKNRWVVERTFAWLGKCRRVSNDDEQNPRSSDAWIRLAMIGLMVRRLACLYFRYTLLQDISGVKTSTFLVAAHLHTPRCRRAVR